MGADFQGSADRPRYSKQTLFATLAIAICLMLALELRWPYYFLQDDGLEEFLPSYFHNWRSILSGHLPLYDFHIFAGIPHMAMGQTGVFYVPEYVAMFLSQAIWGHPFAAIDLMAFMHGLIAVAGGYILLTYIGASEAAAAFGALTALSGFFIWAGRMWPSVPMLCAWFPWMVWASLRYLDKPTVTRASWLMLFRLALLYGGYAHFFILAIVFEHIVILTHLTVTRRVGGICLYGKYIALYVPTALLGLPYLLPGIAAATRSLERSKPLSYAEFSSLKLSPLWWFFGQVFVFVQLHLPRDYIQASIPYVSYIGYIPSALSLGAGALWEKNPRFRQVLVASGVCFSVAFLWCSNVLGPTIYHLPVLNRLRWPFKLVYFAGFFQCLVATLVLTLLSRRWQRIAIAGLIVNWIAVFCFLPNHAWRIRKYHPPLESPWQTNLADGRYFVISRGAVSHLSRQYVELDFAELWGLDNLLGYEPLLSRTDARAITGKYEAVLDLHPGSYDGPVNQQLLNHLKKWSVKYILVDPARSYASEELARAGFQIEAAKEGWTLWKDPTSLPRVHWSDVPSGTSAGAGIHWAEHVNSIDVYLNQWPSRQLTFAFVANPGLETCIENHCTPVAQSADGLVRVSVPQGTRHVRLVYHEALLLPSVLIALATLGVWVVLLFRSGVQSRRLLRTPQHTSVVARLDVDG